MITPSIIARLDRVLAPKGFIRKNATWNREQDSSVEVIDIQISKGLDRATMNAGVLSRPVYFICWGRDAEPFVEEPSCTVRARIGQLVDNKDHWWSLSDAGVADEMADCLEMRIFPFLERMRSLEAMRDWLASTGVPSPRFPLPTICFAVLQARLGDVGGARELLAELELKALGGWKVRAREVGRRIGCAAASAQ